MEILSLDVVYIMSVMIMEWLTYAAVGLYFILLIRPYTKTEWQRVPIITLNRYRYLTMTIIIINIIYS